MNRRRWGAAIAILAAIGLIAVWVRFPRPLPEERAVAERLRHAKAIDLTTTLSNQGAFGPERLELDAEALADRFRLKEKHGKNLSVASVISVTLCDAADGGEFVRVCGSGSCCFIDGTLFGMEHGFWGELLRQAPKTKVWLLDKTPLSFEDGEPIDR